MIKRYWLRVWAQTWPSTSPCVSGAWCVQGVSALQGRRFRPCSARSDRPSLWLLPGCETPPPTVSTPAQLTWNKYRPGRGRGWLPPTRFPWPLSSLPCQPCCWRDWRVLATTGSIPPYHRWSAGVSWSWSRSCVGWVGSNGGERGLGVATDDYGWRPGMNGTHML